MKFFAILLGLLITSLVAQGATPLEEAKEFFNTYTNLYAKFDPGVADLYADDAVIVSRQDLPEGRRRELTLTGSQHKQWLRSTASARKAIRRVETYSEVDYKEENGKVRITSRRYVEPNNDQSRVMMVISKQDDRWLIVEQLTESKQVAVRPKKEGLPQEL